MGGVSIMTLEEQTATRMLVLFRFVRELTTLDLRNTGKTVPELEREIRERARFAIRYVRAIGDPPALARMINREPLAKLKEFTAKYHVVTKDEAA